MLRIISAGEMEKYLNRRDVVIIDLRDSKDYERMHLLGAVNVTYERLINHMGNISKSKTFMIYCDKGNLSLKACVKLDKRGYNVISVGGGFEALRAHYCN